MSLPARDRRALESISEGLAGSDTGLVRLLSMFTHLAEGEEMPSREQIPASLVGAARYRARSGRRLGSSPGGSHGRSRLGFGAMLMLLWLMLTAVLIALAVTLGSGGNAVCPHTGLSGCARAAHPAVTPPGNSPRVPVSWP
jgi:hypothetical protein